MSNEAVRIVCDRCKEATAITLRVKRGGRVDLCRTCAVAFDRENCECIYCKLDAQHETAILHGDLHNVMQFDRAQGMIHMMRAMGETLFDKGDELVFLFQFFAEHGEGAHAELVRRYIHVLEAIKVMEEQGAALKSARKKTREEA